MSRKPNQSLAISQKEQRRRKRLSKKNGDRQYFAAVRKLRRDALDKWQLEHKPERMKKRLVQLTLAAKKRQMKQEARDKAKESNDA